MQNCHDGTVLWLHIDINLAVSVCFSECIKIIGNRRHIVPGWLNIACDTFSMAFPPFLYLFPFLFVVLFVNIIFFIYCFGISGIDSSRFRIVKQSLRFSPHNAVKRGGPRNGLAPEIGTYAEYKTWLGHVVHHTPLFYIDEKVYFYTAKFGLDFQPSSTLRCPGFEKATYLKSSRRCVCRVDDGSMSSPNSM